MADDFKLLKLTCFVGKFFALTPTGTGKNDPRCNQTFRILVVIILLGGLIAGVALTAMHTQARNVTVILIFLDHAILCGTNIYIVLALGFWKRQYWYHLIQKLRLNNDLLKTYTSSGSSLYLWFLLPNVVELLILTGHISALCLEGISLEVVKNAFDFFQWYLSFYNKLLLYVFGRMLRMRYQGLKNSICDVKFYELAQTVRKLGSKVNSLKQAVNLYNQIFGWLMVLVITYATLEVLKWIPVFILIAHQKIPFQISLVTGILNSAFHVTWTVVIIQSCEAVEEEAMEILERVQGLVWSLDGSDWEKKLHLCELARLISNNLPEFTAANFFTVKKSTILDVLGTIVTFSIIVIQFENT